MKYLRNINESFTTQDIKDCFQDLVDCGFNVDLTFKIIYDKLGYNELNIRKRENDLLKSFKLNDIVETLLFAIPYLEEKYNFDTKYFMLYMTDGTKHHYYTLEKMISSIQNTNPTKWNYRLYKFVWRFEMPDETEKI